MSSSGTDLSVPMLVANSRHHGSCKREMDKDPKKATGDQEIMVIKSESTQRRDSAGDAAQVRDGGKAEGRCRQAVGNGKVAGEYVVHPLSEPYGAPTHMAASMKWVLFVGVQKASALQFTVYIRAPDF